MFCIICGGGLCQDGAFCPKCGIRLDKSADSFSGGFIRYKYCSKCGTASADAYCSKYGESTEPVCYEAFSAKKYIGETAGKLAVAVEGAKTQFEGVVGDVAELVKNKKDAHKYLTPAFLLLFFLAYIFIAHIPGYYKQEGAYEYVALHLILAIIVAAGYYAVYKFMEKGAVKNAFYTYIGMALSVIVINPYIFYSLLTSGLEFNNKIFFAALTVLALAIILFKASFLIESVLPKKDEEKGFKISHTEQMSAFNSDYLNWPNSAIATAICLPLFYSLISPVLCIIHFAAAACLAGYIFYLQKNVYNIN